MASSFQAWRADGTRCPPLTIQADFLFQAGCLMFHTALPTRLSTALWITLGIDAQCEIMFGFKQATGEAIREDSHGETLWIVNRWLHLGDAQGACNFRRSA